MTANVAHDLESRSLLDPQAYIQERLDDQIAWYDRKSMDSQKWYKRLRLFEIIAAASIPVLAGRASDAQPGWSIATGVLGALIAIIAAIIGLYQFERLWVEYRTTSESLKKERFLYLTRSEPYPATDPKAFETLVHRVESLISKENTDWGQYVSRPKRPTPRSE